MEPINFFPIRIDGHIIWQTDLVPLAQGPIEDIRRIWADGKLVYDATDEPDAQLNGA